MPRFIIGAAIGSGTTALAAERGGADLLLAINAGRLRSMGAPSIACMLPILDAGTLTEEFARREVLTQCAAPVLLGVNVWGGSLDVKARAREIAEAGFAGAVNFPSSMHYSRPMQQILARAGRGIDKEVEQLRAVQDAGLTAMFYCATRTQARLAADAGLDMVCLNLGWNVGGVRGHRRRASLEEVATIAREIGRLVRRINPATRFLLEGGPIASAEDLARVVALADIDGYVGGSTIERIPLESSVAEQIDRFRRAGRRSGPLDAGDRRLVAWGRPLGFVGRSAAQVDFLKRLRALAAGALPALLVAERGTDMAPLLAAFARQLGAGRVADMVQIDVAGEEFPRRARTILFGHRETLSGRAPVLADDAVRLVVVRAPERLPGATQVRLARALEEGMFRVTGTRRSLRVRPRVLLVSELESIGDGLERELAAAGMHPVLYGALAGSVLRAPPLRERVDDLMAIIEERSGALTGTALGRSSFSPGAVKRLKAHRWPGNERELRALLGSLAGRGSSEPVRREELELDGPAAPESAGDLKSEKGLIVDALWRHGFNRTRTAESLGISRKTLYNKMCKYGLLG